MRLYLLIFLSLLSFQTTAKSGMVVSEHKLATEAGASILRAGGNAIDAAVAVGYALAVVNPCCGNIGGGGFMTLHLADGTNLVINFREKAPIAATSTLYLNKQGQLKPDATTKGYLAVAVPGTVMGLNTALQRYGSMSRQQVMAPAIRLAKNGYRISAYEADQLKSFTADFRAQPNIAAIFLKKGKPIAAGNKLVQSDLAHTLELIANDGTDAFYKGPIAKAVVSASKAHGGILSLTDFADYTVTIDSPITCDYRGYTIIAPPPPSSGGVTLCTMLQTLAATPIKQIGYQKINGVDAILRAMGKGFIERNKNTRRDPLDTLQHELTDTTHYSIVDKEGNAVAVTYTLNGFFGARVMAGNTSFFLNDEMDDFTAKAGVANKFGLVQSDTNEIAPGKRPLSSMTPTIVMKGGHPYLVLGSPGGPRIITSILLTLLNIIDYGMDLKTAINAPRYHYQVIPNTVDFEPNAFPPKLKKELTHRGYHIRQQHTWSALEAIQIDNNGKLTGANDYRRPDGLAAEVRP